MHALKSSGPARLAAFVFACQYETRDPSHRRFVETGGDDFSLRLFQFDEAFEDRVEHFVRRQRILIGLVLTQLGRRWTLDNLRPELLRRRLACCASAISCRRVACSNP